MGLAVTVSFHPDTGDAVEVFMTGRGKCSDNEMQNILYDMGVTVSKMMQKETDFGFSTETDRLDQTA
tara:strand:+ start:265 stop:465 length:201 start_codon:yes stop_codon:yes gene_type:complete